VLENPKSEETIDKVPAKHPIVAWEDEMDRDPTEPESIAIAALLSIEMEVLGAETSSTNKLREFPVRVETPFPCICLDNTTIFVRVTSFCTAIEGIFNEELPSPTSSTPSQVTTDDEMDTREVSMNEIVAPEAKAKELATFKVAVRMEILPWVNVTNPSARSVTTLVLPPKLAVVVTGKVRVATFKVPCTVKVIALVVGLRIVFAVAVVPAGTRTTVPAGGFKETVSAAEGNRFGDQLFGFDHKPSPAEPRKVITACVSAMES